MRKAGIYSLGYKLRSKTIYLEFHQTKLAWESGGLALSALMVTLGQI